MTRASFGQRSIENSIELAMLNIKQGLVFLVSHCLLSQVVVYEEVRNVMLIFILWVGQCCWWSAELSSD